MRIVFHGVNNDTQRWSFSTNILNVITNLLTESDEPVDDTRMISIWMLISSSDDAEIEVNSGSGRAKWKDDKGVVIPICLDTNPTELGGEPNLAQLQGSLKGVQEDVGVFYPSNIVDVQLSKLAGMIMERVKASKMFTD